MSEVPGVEELTRVYPTERPLEAVGRITSPVAADHDSHLGGFAQGRRFLYLDAMQFVWWAPGSLPAVGYGSGPHGAGAYGEPFVPGFGRGDFGSGAYGETEV